MNEIRSGIYRHYKGPLYLVLGLAHDANADEIGDTALVRIDTGKTELPFVHPFGERTVVVYVPLQLDGAHLGPRMAVRTVEDFTAWVCSNPAHSSYGQRMPFGRADGDEVQRFTYLGPELTADMIPSEVTA